MLKISASKLGTVQAGTDEFLAMVTEGLVYGVYQVVTWSSFGVSW